MVLDHCFTFKVRMPQHSQDQCKFLQAKIGKEREFEAALQRLRGQNADTSHEASEIKVTHLVT